MQISLSNGQILRLAQVKEGDTVYYVPEESLFVKKIPRKRDVAFYNPKQSFNRDVSVCAIEVFLEKYHQTPHVTRACEPLCATGIRGIRYLLETRLQEVTMTDLNPVAIKIATFNLSYLETTLTNLKKKVILQRAEASRTLLTNAINFQRFCITDIDPFGSPSPFLYPAILATEPKGLIAVTATDTAPLTGVYPHALFKKYLASMIGRVTFYNELALRRVITYAMRIGFLLGIAMVPVLSFAIDHYFRVFFIKSFKKNVEDLVSDIGFLLHCKQCLYTEIWKKFESPPAAQLQCSYCNASLLMLGPLYLGSIQNRDFINETIRIAEERTLTQKERVLKYLHLLKQETTLNLPWYYDLHHLASYLQTSAPSTVTILTELEQQGYTAIRTHCSPTAIKTNAPIKVLHSIVLRGKALENNA